MERRLCLVDAALHNFPQAAHVCGFRHLQQSVELHYKSNSFLQTQSENTFTISLAGLKPVDRIMKV